MMIILSFVVQFLTYLSFVSANLEKELGSVIFVNLLWRHGERNPVTFYANDPYQNESYWPTGIGELTNEGKKQHYELGKWLRRRYDSLLTDEYSPDRVHVQSTDVDRTIMSAQCNLAGMYPPRDSQVWDMGLLWQPVPIHTTPKENDKVLGAEAVCPAYDKEFDEVSKSEEINNVYDKYRDVVDAVRDNTGKVDVDFKYIHDTWDTLTIEKRRGYALPTWAQDILPRMYGIARYRFTVESWTKKLGRLKSGLLIEEMIENMKNRTENKNSRVVNIYSAHDVTIANFLNTLGMYDGNIPPLASCLMVEVREDSHGAHYVTMIYRYSSTEEPKLLTVPGCTAACPLDKFISLTKPLIPEDWDKECQS